VSQYDSFLGNILRILYRANPDLLNSSERNFTYASLRDFESLDDVRNHILEKEIETVLRDSHASQFDWMEKKFDLSLRNGLTVWPKFIELTERRNLFTHCNGVVSAQYLSVCDKHKVAFDPRPKLNDQLRVRPDYFYGAYKCLFEIGAKLANVLWRKAIPQKRAAADEHLTNFIYDLVVHERYELAISLSDFALNTPPISKNCDEDSRLRTIINMAQAHKWSKQQDIALLVLKRDSWATRNDVFQLAVAVIRDDFNGASVLMKRIGPDGKITANDYRDWPLFQEFRKTKEFTAAYQDVFGCEFQPLDRDPLHKLFSRSGSAMIGPVARALTGDTDPSN